MKMNYVEETPDGGWRINGSRVSLDSVIHAYHEGDTAEQISRNFPSLSLEQVYGAFAFYLHNREKIDRYFKAQTARWEKLEREAAQRNRRLRDRILSRHDLHQVREKVQ